MNECFRDGPVELQPCLAGDWAGAGLKTVRLSPDGVVKSKNGTYTLDEEGAAQLIAAFDAHGVDAPVDFEHETLGVDKAATHRAPAAGWIKKVWHEKGRGLLALVKWNDDARDLIRNGSYAYLSPVFGVSRLDRRVVALHSAGLTNKPAIPRMERLVASENIETEIVSMADDKVDPNLDDPGAAGTNMRPAEQLLEEIVAELKGKGVEVIEGGSIEQNLEAVLAYVKGEAINPKAINPQANADVPAASPELVAMREREQERIRDDQISELLQPFAERRTSLGDMDRLSKIVGEEGRAFIAFAQHDLEACRHVMGRIFVGFPPQGRTTAPARPSTSRGQTISHAIRAFHDDPKLTLNTSVEAFAGLALRDAGLPGLEDGELVTYV